MVAEKHVCLACGGPLDPILDHVHDTRFGIDKTFTISRCSVCGLEQTTPRLRADELGALYSTHYNFRGESGTRYTRIRERFLSSVAYRLWMAVDGDISFHSRPGHGRLIDIGCNEGRGLTLYARNGFSAVEGLETNPVAAETALGRGFAVYGIDLPEFHPEQLYDVAILSNVIEHAVDPLEMLRQVKRILRPGGQVWITCPNASSWQRKLFGRAWINWHVPFHIAHFTDRTLSEVVAKAGFTTVERIEVSPALWAAQSMLALTSVRGQSTGIIRNPLAVILFMGFVRLVLFPFFWLGNRVGRGDCLVHVAQVT